MSVAHSNTTRPLSLRQCGQGPEGFLRLLTSVDTEEEMLSRGRRGPWRTSSLDKVKEVALDPQETC